MYIAKVVVSSRARYIYIPSTYNYNEAYIISRRLFEKLKDFQKYCTELVYRLGSSNIVKIMIALQYNRIVELVRLLFRKKRVHGTSSKRISLRETDVDECGEVVVLSPDEFELQVKHIAQGIVCYIFCTAEEATRILIRTLERFRDRITSSNH